MPVDDEGAAQASPGLDQRAMQAHRMRRAESRDDIASCGYAAQEYLYRPGELLVALDDLPVVEAALVEEEVAFERPEDSELADDARLARFSMPRQVDIPALVSRLRAAPTGRIPRVGPNHVFSGEPAYHGGPADFPKVTKGALKFEAGAGADVSVAVLDTGFSPGIHQWLDDHCRSAPGDAEELNVSPADGWLDDEAGHGTFIAGIILQRAPGATVDLAKVLDSEGYGDELGIARAIVRFAKHDVLNLSLGGYSHGNAPPLALVEALRQVAPGSVVVAAAGNNGSDRPMWPAAFKRVIAVAAIDASASARAPFSNFGRWVDACAPALDVLSTFVEFSETASPSGGRKPQAFRGWATWSGTSFAAPKVAGEIAAVKSRQGSGSARQAALSLLGGTERMADLGTVLRL